MIPAWSSGIAGQIRAMERYYQDSLVLVHIL